MSAHFNRTCLAMLTGAMAASMIPVSPALAQDSQIVVRGLPEGVKMETVSYRDLNLRYIHDINKLNDRVDQAVRRVCDFQVKDPLAASYRHCSEAAWAGARPQIHRAYLRANRLAGL